MEMTQADYIERLERVDDGTADDEDRRLIKHYAREGYERPADGSWLFDDSKGVTRPRNANYGALSRAQLVATAKKRGINSSGSQEQLIERLREHDQKTNDTAETDKQDDDK